MLFVLIGRVVDDSMQAAVCMTKGRCRAVLSAVCFSLVASSGYGQSQPSTAPYVPITMQQAVDLARARNPSLLSAQQNLLSVKAQEIQAGVRQNPNLVVTGSDVTLGAYGNNPYYYSVGVSRLFERGEKRRWRLDYSQSTTAQTDAQ
jgi:outer membrane protein, heavy metal efflux system